MLTYDYLKAGVRVIPSCLHIYQIIYIFYYKQLVLLADENVGFPSHQTKTFLICHYMQIPYVKGIARINMGQMST